MVLSLLLLHFAFSILWYYRMKLSTMPTSGDTNEVENLLREGLVLKVTLDDGTTGFGEVR